MNDTHIHSHVSEPSIVENIEAPATPLMKPRAVPRWLQYTVWLTLCAGLALAASAHIVQLAFIKSIDANKAELQSLFSWNDDVYIIWRSFMTDSLEISISTLLTKLIVLVLCLATRWPGRAWMRYESSQDASLGKKQRIYFAAAMIAIAVSCALSITDISKLTIDSLLLKNSIPIIVIVLTRLYFGRGWRAAMAAMVIFSATSYISLSLVSEAISLTRVPVINSAEVTPLVKFAITKLAQKVGFPESKIYAQKIIQGAFVGTIFGNLMLLHEDLLQEDNIEKMLGVAAHEFGHFKDKYAISKPFVSSMQMAVRGLVPFLLATSQISWVLQIFGATNVVYPFGLGLVIAPIVTNAFATLIEPMRIVLLQRGEVFADNYAMKLGYAKQLAMFLSDFADKSPETIAHPLYEFLYMEHPSIFKRVKAANKYAAHETGAFSLEELKAEFAALQKDPDAKH